MAGIHLILRALAKLLSYQGANFECNLIKELCELTGIQKDRTSPYHDQTNEQARQVHQMLMHMIGKLSKDWKPDWPKHLLDLVHAYNSTRLAITRYSPHYLMFGHCPHLPVNFYFPTMRAWRHWHINYYGAELCEQMQEAFKEVQVQSTSVADKTEAVL